eukprot:TRINITY_DN8565_c0_g1_i5.p1 TRINITY_DN8565_c0_g1~~TRINITY_DN8565_c0_g1_i5.p1  ORF type:complete len:160 (-),score=5.80 TRINITY_DN8565_c0_g1_i5:275-754(-)
MPAEHIASVLIERGLVAHAPESTVAHLNCPDDIFAKLAGPVRTDSTVSRSSHGIFVNATSWGKHAGYYIHCFAITLGADNYTPGFVELFQCCEIGTDGFNLRQTPFHFNKVVKSIAALKVDIIFRQPESWQHTGRQALLLHDLFRKVQHYATFAVPLCF